MLDLWLGVIDFNNVKHVNKNKNKNRGRINAYCMVSNKNRWDWCMKKDKKLWNDKSNA